MSWSLWLGLACALLAGPAAASDAPSEEPICADRPAKGNSTCTVPVGMLQLEIGAADRSLAKSGDTRIELLTIGSSFVKVGLSDRSDLEVGFTPFARLTVEQGTAYDRAAGFGDVVVRYKHRLTTDGANVEIALIPFAKLPTAAGELGNGKVEGGLAVPVGFDLGALTVTLGPEVDVLANLDGHGHHAAVANLLNVGIPLADGLTLAAELWANVNFAPAETVKQASADLAVAYLLSNDVQLDAGANFGLTRDTPDTEFYAGVSVRF